MKNITSLLYILLFLTTAISQIKKVSVPKQVLKSFSEKFDNATDVKWEKEGSQKWEAEFKIEERNYSANFSNDGVWLETEYKINVSELPDQVQQTIDSEFDGYEIESVEVSETTDGIVYELKLEKDETEIEVFISSNGDILRKESEDSEAVENDENDENDDKEDDIN